MSTLVINEHGELSLTLRGEAENRVLNTLRRLPFWERVSVERDPADESRYLSVTLIAGAGCESTVREILKRSFDITFPREGGESERPLKPPPPAPTRRRH